MLKKLLALSAATAMLTGAALANAPAKDAGKKAAKKPVATKLTDVKVCPMTGEEVKGKGAGSEVVGNYKVNFCCAGCKPDFDKLSKADKQKKIAEALKKQSGKKG